MHMALLSRSLGLVPPPHRPRPRRARPHDPGRAARHLAKGPSLLTLSRRCTNAELTLLNLDVQIKMIENRLKIERQVDLGRQEARARLASSSSTASNGNGSASLAPPPLTRHNSSGDHLLIPREPRVASPARARTASPAPRGQAQPDRSGSGSGDTEHDDDFGDDDEGLDSVRVDDNSAAAKKRRRAILERLGLRGAAGRGASALPLGGGSGSASGSDSGMRPRGGTVDGRYLHRGGEGETEDGEGESDWTSGGEGAPPLMPLGGSGVRRRLRSSSLGQMVGMSSDEEGPAGAGGRW